MVRSIRRNIVRCRAPKGTSPNIFLHEEWIRMHSKKVHNKHFMF